MKNRKFTSIELLEHLKELSKNMFKNYRDIDKIAKTILTSGFVDKQMVEYSDIFAVSYSELDKERNELAKQLILRKDMSPSEAFVCATDLFKLMYGERNAGDAENDANQSFGVSLHTDEQGAKWVRIRAWGEDFSLSLYDMRDGDKKDFTWEEAMEFAEFHGQELPSKKQWMLVDMLREDIDRIIKDNGGDELERWYWSKSVVQYFSITAWFYSGNYGTLNDDFKYVSYGGRTIVYRH